ncbi:protein SUPPRESSOR OF MAX2 1-like [Mangifera indica]|uniref:protein SUPPRESSOR OF MAX2 1-like n=1 Tax=Mangifera indica TaxID=29780 RepID=UPI001CF93802|nr:protein SUPPRESSOR OF MAX2 1-like [Mangifera indica]XP_044463983.1 protein SUPPRESSOR OF MAX2 1-like [Mangifera indica]
MRTGLSTIQQTLTPEAASVLNHSIAEAGRRNHGQTTPLHVAATLLAAPSGFLRQACIKSHPNSSHPLQCRALELCFSVALDRLPTAQNISPGLDPPISNALMAALKRAQAHQRRGCPEQQQQPLLAVKVELEQLIISILDDPSVSRVMREASFSSPAVKATIEQSLNSTPCSVSVSNSSSIGLGFRPNLNRNLYVNPRLQQGAGGGVQSGQQRGEEVKRVMDILMRSKKKNPVLVGESEPEMIVKELLIKIESNELDGVLKNVEVIRLGKDFSFEKGDIVAKLRELSGLIESKMIGNGGVIVDMGDLKWLVEQQLGFGVSNLGAVQHQQAVAEAVAEMGKMMLRFSGGGGGGRLWLIGTATCETYLRCQVYHPSMENDWDLQAVPIAAKAAPGMFPRIGNNGNGILSSSVGSLSPFKGFPAATTRRVSENMDPVRRMSCCPQCMQNYEQELAKLAEKSSSEVKSEAARPSLPQWLHNAKAHDDAKTVDQTLAKDQDLIWKQKSQELQKKWNETCLHLHPNFHQPGFGMERIAPAPPPMTGLYNPSLLTRQPFQPKLQLNRNLGDALQLNTNLVSGHQSDRLVSPPGSPVRTDLVLGRSRESTPEKIHKERVKDFLGCISSEPQSKCHELQSDNLPDAADAVSFKMLAKGLAEKVWWQKEAATAVATTVTQCKLGNGKSRGAGSRGDMWLLFTGPDRVGKKKMASALSELVCSASPIMISLGSRRDDGDSDVRVRGKTTLDRIGEAVKRHPFSVILLEDIDEAEMLLRGSIKRAMERGRLIDSHGREINLGKVIFILTANWLPDSLKFLSHGITLDEKKLASLASGGWQLRLSLWDKTVKRRPSWLHNEERSTKTRKETGLGLSFDLNQAADVGDDKADGSHNSSDLTIDHEEEHGLNNRLLLSPSTSPASHDLLDTVDSAIVFKPVDFSPIRRNITNSITKKFSAIIGSGVSLEILDEALEKIVGGIWFGRTGLEEWLDKVLIPSLHQLKSRLPTNAGMIDESMVVRLETDNNSGIRSLGDLLPSGIKVVAEGL